MLRKGQEGDAAEFLAKVNGYGYNDLCALPRLSKDAILSNLKKRFKGEIVYTYVGDIIVSVNPFKNVGAVGRAIPHQHGHRYQVHTKNNNNNSYAHNYMYLSEDP